MPKTKTSLSRRQVLAAATGIAVVGIGAAGWWSLSSRAAVAGEILAADRAYEMLSAGKVTLVDIRRPKEWAQTGVAEGAERLDMRRRDFVAALDTLVDGDRSAPVALICATGGRSRWLSNALSEAGYTQIYDVSEGMMGSRVGPGWLRRGLPVVK